MLFNYIILFYIYTLILVIKSTLLMSLDVGKSRILTMRGLTNTGTKGGRANGLVVSACKLTCLWCHHKIMFYKIPRGATTTLWVTGISDPLQIYYGRLDEHDWWYAILDTKIWLTDITQFLLAHSYVALENDMLKSYKVAQVWIYFSGCRRHIF